MSIIHFEWLYFQNLSFFPSTSLHSDRHSTGQWCSRHNRKWRYHVSFPLCLSSHSPTPLLSQSCYCRSHLKEVIGYILKLNTLSLWVLHYSVKATLGPFCTYCRLGPNMPRPVYSGLLLFCHLTLCHSQWLVSPPSFYVSFCSHSSSPTFRQPLKQTLKVAVLCCSSIWQCQSWTKVKPTTEVTTNPPPPFSILPLLIHLSFYLTAVSRQNNNHLKLNNLN